MSQKPETDNPEVLAKILLLGLVIATIILLVLFFTFLSWTL